MRWLRGVLVVMALLGAACGDDGGGSKPVPSANAAESKRFCSALTGGGSENDLEKTVPDALKNDFAEWRHGNDPEKKHVGRLNDYAHEACGVPFDEPGFTTTTAPTSTSATVAS